MQLVLTPQAVWAQMVQLIAFDSPVDDDLTGLRLDTSAQV